VSWQHIVIACTERDVRVAGRGRRCGTSGLTQSARGVKVKVDPIASVLTLGLC
jgi:hypothetical protein